MASSTVVGSKKIVHVKCLSIHTSMNTTTERATGVGYKSISPQRSKLACLELYQGNYSRLLLPKTPAALKVLKWSSTRTIEICQKGWYSVTFFFHQRKVKMYSSSVLGQRSEQPGTNRYPVFTVWFLQLCQLARLFNTEDQQLVVTLKKHKPGTLG